jgi:hypothetical protein
VIRKLVAVLGWLLAGHAVLFGLFWLLVQVPDANTLMLGATSLVAVALLVVAAMVEVTAAAWLWPGATFAGALAEGVRGVVPLVCGALVFAGAWWVAGAIDAAFAARRGEIDAWFIATFDTTRTAWVAHLVAALVFLVRWVLGVSAAVAIVHAWLAARWGGLLGLHWVPRAVSRHQLGLTALAMIALVALPWSAAYWRPPGIPPTSVQLLFVGAKLGSIALLAHIGWVMVLAAGVPSYLMSRQSMPRATASATHPAARA